MCCALYVIANKISNNVCIRIYHGRDMGRLTFMCFNKPVADLGFPRGGGANPPGEASIYDFGKFSQKLHEIERIWTPGGET